MSYEYLLVIKENGIATVTINRPPMNPLNTGLIEELGSVADELQADLSVKVVIITGTGNKAFGAGADIAEIVNLTPVGAYNFAKTTRTSFEKIANLEKPVIAAINGLALGGGTELALTCDFRIAAESAKFGLPEITLGLIPGAGGTQRLSRLIGASKAKEMVLFGEMITAEAAEKLGLVNKVVPDGMLMEEAVKMARKLAAKPAVAVKMAKQAINTGVNLDLSSSLVLEVQNFVAAFASEDREEGLAAFIEKRKPNFKDK